jgi:Rrf2 family protein
VNLSKSTRYALYAALDMASAGEGVVTVADTAARYRIPPGALAKVFQQLVRSRIAVGTRGIGGGYRLARPPADVSVLDVVSAFQPPREEGECLLAERHGPGCADSASCRIRTLFDEIDLMTRSTLASVSLATLARTGAPTRG